MFPTTIRAGSWFDTRELAMNSGNATAIISTPAAQGARPSSRQRPQATTNMAAAMDSDTTGNISMMVATSTGIVLQWASEVVIVLCAAPG